MRSGDVTSVFSVAASIMHESIQTFPQDGRFFQRSEIPVDNSEFSTFSTEFSTGVFHRGCGLWIFIFGSHNPVRQPSPDFPLFRSQAILP